MIRINYEKTAGGVSWVESDELWVERDELLCLSEGVVLTFATFNGAALKAAPALLDEGAEDWQTEIWTESDGGLSVYAGSRLLGECDDVRFLTSTEGISLVSDTSTILAEWRDIPGGWTTPDNEDVGVSLRIMHTDSGSSELKASRAPRTRPSALAG